MVVIISRPRKEIFYIPNLCFNMEWTTLAISSFVPNATFPRRLVPFKNIPMGKVI